MLLDLEKMTSRTELRADVCIVGAGVAGITLARELAASKISVCLIESGGLAADPESQELYRGSNELSRLGQRDYLFSSRLRFLGGTSNHWQGACRPFDAIDFRRREWLDASGWPIEKAELNPFYDRACKILQTPLFDDPRDEGSGWDEASDPVALEAFPLKRYRFSKPIRMGIAYRSELQESKHIQLLLHANVIDMPTDASGKRLARVSLSSLGGRKGSVVAKRFVLATGGIENARLLLMAQNDHPNGLGNSNGLVGRYFMGHIEVPKAAEVFLSKTAGPLSHFDRATAWNRADKSQAVFGLSDALQAQHSLLNGGIQFLRADHLGEGRELARGLRQATTPTFGTLRYISEQSALFESRVFLDPSNKDHLGIPRSVLEWRIADSDAQRIYKTLQLFGELLGAASRGRLKILLDQNAFWSACRGSPHHLGTTRMSFDARDGVVDSNCRMHEIENLYLAGSSVFPSGSFANPTLTLTALAVRLADYLAAKKG